MGKIILEFDSTEEQNDARTAMDGWRWKVAMWDLDQKLRETTKHGVSVIHHESNAPELEQNIAEKYREIIREILSDHNISFD